MDLKDYLFAKKEIDSFSVRFVAALKIVSKKYFNGNFNAPAILFALLHDYNDSLNGYQRNVVSNVTLSAEKGHLAKEFFIEVFNDEQAILDYLNGTISDRYFKTKRRTDKNVKTAQEEVNKVVEEALGINLFSQLNLNIED